MEHAHLLPTALIFFNSSQLVWSGLYSSPDEECNSVNANEDNRIGSIFVVGVPVIHPPPLHPFKPSFHVLRPAICETGMLAGGSVTVVHCFPNFEFKKGPVPAWSTCSATPLTHSLARAHTHTHAPTHPRARTHIRVSFCFSLLLGLLSCVACS